MNSKGLWFVVVSAAAVSLSSLAFATPGEGIHVGNLVLSPFATVSGTYDSNVLLAPRDHEEDDFFFDIVPGLAFINRTDRLIINGRGWAQFRQYLDTTDRDSDSYGEKIGAVWGYEDKLSIALMEKFVRLTDYEITPRSVDTLNLTSQNLMLTEDRTERVKRDLFDIAPVVTYKTDGALEFDVGYDYSKVNYATDQLFDWYENRGQIELRRKVSEKTSALLTGQLSEQNSQGFSENSDYYVLRGGLLYHATAKTYLKIGAGVEDYRFGGESPTGQNLDDTIFSYDIAGTWEMTEKIRFELSGRNGIQPATQYDANTKEVNLAAAGVSFDVTETIVLSLAGSFRRDDYIGKVFFNNEFRDKVRDLWGGRARVDYQPRANFLDLYLESTYEDSSDNLQDDFNNYDQWRVSLGLALRY
jgi:hypothetical protein